MSGYLVTVQRDGADKADKGCRAVEGTARLDQVGLGARQLPEAYLTENGTQIGEAFIEWARPLVGNVVPDTIF